MARPISHTPAPAEDDAAGDAVRALVEALHESGVLRALAGAVRGYPDLAGQLVTSLDADVIRALASLGGLASMLGPAGAERTVAGIRSAVAAADHALAADEVPSTVALARSLADPDVRRGAAALVAALGAFGRAAGR